MKKCYICNCERKENLIILGKHICEECEWKILTAQAHKTGYNRCIRKLKGLFETT